MKLKISQYIKREFAPGSEPDRRTIISMIQRGELAGSKVGGQWFVEEQQSTTGNDIADQILRSIV